MSRHTQEIPTSRGTYVLASGVDPPSALMFVQLWGPGTAEDEVPGGPGQESDGTWLLVDVDARTVDELEQAMRDQKHLSLEEAFAAFGTPWPEDPNQQRWYNGHAHRALSAEQRELLGENPSLAAVQDWMLGDAPVPEPAPEQSFTPLEDVWPPPFGPEFYDTQGPRGPGAYLKPEFRDREAYRAYVLAKKAKSDG